MKVRISSEALAAIRAQAAETPDLEVCGLLLGEEWHVTTAVRTDNMASSPAHEFEIDPKALIAAHRMERAGGPKLLGYYHSHPHGPAEPSPTDRANAAADGRLWLIVGGEEVAAWRAEPGGFTVCRLEVTCLPSSCRT